MVRIRVYDVFFSTVVRAREKLAQHLQRLRFHSVTSESAEAEWFEIETIILAICYEICQDLATHRSDAESVPAESCADN